MPTPSCGHHHVLVAVDHTIRYLVTALVPDVSSRHVIGLLQAAIVYIYGPPCLIVSDNAKGLDSAAFRGFLAHHPSDRLTPSPMRSANSFLMRRLAIGLRWFLT